MKCAKYCEGKLARGKVGEDTEVISYDALGARIKSLDFILIAKGSHSHILNTRMISDLCIPCAVDPFT